MTLKEKFESECKYLLDTDDVIPAFQKRGAAGEYALEHVRKAFEIYKMGFLAGRDNERN